MRQEFLSMFPSKMERKMKSDRSQTLVNSPRYKNLTYQTSTHTYHNTKMILAAFPLLLCLVDS